MKSITFNPHSSFITEVKYDEEKQTLRVRINDYWYYYIGVTIQKMYRFRKAPSRGKYFIERIKGQYKVIRRKAR